MLYVTRRSSKPPQAKAKISLIQAGLQKAGGVDTADVFLKGFTSRPGAFFSLFLFMHRGLFACTNEFKTGFLTAWHLQRLMWTDVTVQFFFLHDARTKIKPFFIDPSVSLGGDSNQQPFRKSHV